MTLPNFISRALSFFDKAEKQFESAEQAKSKILALEGELAKAKAAALEVENSVKDLQGKLTKAESEVATNKATIAKLEGELTKEKGKANATIAGQGLDPASVPSSEVNSSAATPQENAWNKYQELLAKDSRAAGAYWAQNADKILADRFKA